MKVIKTPCKGEHILTPWLTRDEAAAYCGISRETWRILNIALPCPATGGNRHNARYYVPVISAWWQKIATTETSPAAPEEGEGASHD